MPGGVPSLLSQAPGLFFKASGPNGGDPGVTNVPALYFWTTLNVIGATCLIMKNRLTVSVAQSGPHVPESPVVLGYGPKCIVPGSDERTVGFSVAKRSSICVWVSRLRIPSSPPPSPAGAADIDPGAPIASTAANPEATTTNLATARVSISYRPLVEMSSSSSFGIQHRGFTYRKF